VLTPTYHVFDLYSVHQDATMVPVDVQSEQYALGDYSVPESEAWTSSFEAGSMSNVAPPPLGGTLDPVLAPMPDQVLVPLPPAAWTGFAGLVGLGLFGVMKRARRVLR